MNNQNERKIVYLVNPVSGTTKKESLVRAIQEATKAKEIAHEVVHTNAEGDYDFLKHRIAKEGITDIVMIGGDGTVNQVVSALCDTGVSFGIIPTGSGNGLAFC